MSILTQALETLLKDYWEEYPSTSKVWCWKSFRNFYIPPEESIIIENTMSLRSFSLSSSKDKLIWMGSKTREYNSKDGYNYLSQCKIQTLKLLPTLLCWHPLCLPKTGTFTWLQVQKKILTTDKIKRIGYEGPSRCPLCKATEENPNYIFLQCDYSHIIWTWFYKRMNLYLMK